MPGDGVEARASIALQAGDGGVSRIRTPFHVPGMDRIPYRRDQLHDTGGVLVGPSLGFCHMDEELRQMALEVLEDVAHWSLRSSGWERFGRGLADMERTLRAADVTGFRRAVADVEMAGPHRISGVEEASSLPCPEVFRERVNELIHRLHATRDEQPSSEGADAGEPGRHD
ncbi:CATRA system-associated protein [Streptomyces sp. URMC 126]